MPEIIRYQGRQYSWNNTLSTIDGQPWRGITAVDTGDKLDPETVYSQDGSGAPIGATMGQYEVTTFTLKMLAEYWAGLQNYLAFQAPGIPVGTRGPLGTYGPTQFSYQLTIIDEFAVGATPVIINVPFARITEAKLSTAKGNAALEYELTCWASQIIVNGATLFTPPLGF
jgi:hypothetical protein